MGRYLDREMEEWMDLRRMDECWMHGCMNGWMEGWMMIDNRWMSDDEWMDD